MTSMVKRNSFPNPKIILSCSVTEPTDNASVSFVKYKGDYYVSTETNFMYRINPETLETLEKVPLYLSL